MADKPKGLPKIKLNTPFTFTVQQPTNFSTYVENGVQSFTFIFDNRMYGYNHRAHWNQPLISVFERLNTLILNKHTTAWGQYPQPEVTPSGHAYTNPQQVSHRFTDMKIEPLLNDPTRGIVTLKGIFINHPEIDQLIAGLSSGVFKFAWRGQHRQGLFELETFDICFAR